MSAFKHVSLRYRKGLLPTKRFPSTTRETREKCGNCAKNEENRAVDFVWRPWRDANCTGNRIRSIVRTMLAGCCL
jgi:hypothetical protein